MTDFAPEVSRQSTKLNKAETFAESDVTVSPVAAEVSSGSVVPRETVFNLSQDGGTEEAGECGTEFSPNVPFDRIEVTLMPFWDDASIARLVRSSDSKILEEQSGTFSGGDTLSFSHDFVPEESYSILLENESKNVLFGYSYATPTDETDVFDIVGFTSSVLSPEQGTAVFFSKMRASPSKSVATIEWPMPQDIMGWDIVPFQATNKSAVNVYVEEYKNGEWSEIAGPVSRGYSINADPSNNVRFRVELSISDGVEPSLDAIYRRIKV